MGFGDFFQFGAAGGAMFLFYLLAAKHINGNTEAIHELVGVIRELRGYIKGKNE